MRWFTAALAAWVVLVVQSVNVGPALSQPTQDAYSNWSDAVARLADEYQQAVPRLHALGDEVIRGASVARGFQQSGDTAGGEAWASGWVPAIQAELDAELARINALPDGPPPSPAPTSAEERDWIARSEANSRANSRAMKAAVREAVGRLTELTGLAARISQGDAAAIANADLAYQDLNIVLLDIQAQRFKSMLATGANATSPQESGLKIMMHACSALAQAQRTLRASTTGEAFDSVAVSRIIRADATAISTAALEMDRRAKSEAAQFERDRQLPAEMKEAVRRAYATFPESVALAEQMAAEMRVLADAVAAKDYRAVEAAGARILPLFRGIGEVDDRRRAMLL